MDESKKKSTVQEDDEDQKVEKLKSFVKARPRDKNGHFINLSSQPETPALKQEQVAPTQQQVETTGALSAISQYVSSGKKPDDDETLVDVKVRNPLHKITKLLQDMRSKQSTTVSMRFTIPLIALPIVLLAAFQLGRAQTTCATRFTSQIGIIRTIAVLTPVESKDVFTSLLSFFPEVPKLQKSTDLVQMNRTILVDLEGKVINVLHDGKLDISEYNNQGVILTGTLSPCADTITLDDKRNITTTD